jgi:hypothetical protein
MLRRATRDVTFGPHFTVSPGSLKAISQPRKIIKGRENNGENVTRACFKGVFGQKIKSKEFQARRKCLARTTKLRI